MTADATGSTVTDRRALTSQSCPLGTHREARPIGVCSQASWRVTLAPHASLRLVRLKQGWATRPG